MVFFSFGMELDQPHAHIKQLSFFPSLCMFLSFSLSLSTDALQLDSVEKWNKYYAYTR